MMGEKNLPQVPLLSVDVMLHLIHQELEITNFVATNLQLYMVVATREQLWKTANISGN